MLCYFLQINAEYIYAIDVVLHLCKLSLQSWVFIFFWGGGWGSRYVFHLKFRTCITAAVYWHTAADETEGSQIKEPILFSFIISDPK